MDSGREFNLNLALRDVVQRSGGTFQALKKKKKMIRIKVWEWPPR